jgi:hypothetical protein
MALTSGPRPGASPRSDGRTTYLQTPLDREVIYGGGGSEFRNPQRPLSSITTPRTSSDLIILATGWSCEVTSSTRRGERCSSGLLHNGVERLLDEQCADQFLGCCAARFKSGLQAIEPDHRTPPLRNEAAKYRLTSSAAAKPLEISGKWTLDGLFDWMAKPSSS